MTKMLNIKKAWVSRPSSSVYIAIVQRADSLGRKYHTIQGGNNKYRAVYSPAKGVRRISLGVAMAHLDNGENWIQMVGSKNGEAA